MTALSVASSERFLREAADLDVEKADLKHLQTLARPAAGQQGRAG